MRRLVSPSTSTSLKYPKQECYPHVILIGQVEKAYTGEDSDMDMDMHMNLDANTKPYTLLHSGALNIKEEGSISRLFHFQLRAIHT